MLRVGGTITPQMVDSVMRIAVPDYAESAPSVPLAAAEHATHLYRKLFQYSAPFDPAVLAEFWRRCRAPASQEGRCELGLQEAIALDWTRTSTLR
jgi:hypothetical protein